MVNKEIINPRVNRIEYIFLNLKYEKKLRLFKLTPSLKKLLHIKKSQKIMKLFWGVVYE